jgi:uncharacterized protein YggE
MFRVDGETPWGRVIEVMDVLKKDQIEVAGLVTDNISTVLDYVNQQKLYREKGLREPASAK